MILLTKSPTDDNLGALFECFGYPETTEIRLGGERVSELTCPGLYITIGVEFFKRSLSAVCSFSNSSKNNVSVYLGHRNLESFTADHFHKHRIALFGIATAGIDRHSHAMGHKFRQCRLDRLEEAHLECRADRLKQK